MRDYIILNGQKSTDIKGLLIQELPPIIKPILRTEIEEIDGRDGDIVTPLGYAAYDKTATIGLYGNYDIDEVMGYFNGSGVVTFSNEPDKYYNYQILDQIDYNKLMRFKTAEVTFHVQPFKYSLAESPTEFNSNTVSGQGLSFNLTTGAGVVSNLKILGNSQQVTDPTATSPVPVKVITGNNNLVLVQGSNTEIYPYNLGSVELAYLSYGADTYQDYIYYQNGNWYLYKALGRLNVDTSNVTAITSYSNVEYAVIPRANNSLNYGTYQSVPCLCTNALYSYGLSSGWNTAEAVNKIFTQADNVTYWLGFAAGTTLAQMKTALNGAIIYYPLAAPTTTQITDQTLINALNAILQAEVAGGQLTVKSTVYTRAQPIYFLSVKSEAMTVRNVGNIYARPIMTINGTGVIDVYLNNAQIFTIDMGNSDTITIDTAQMEAYAGGVLMNRNVTGSYDNFVLNVGNNTLSFTGDVEQVTLQNYSRWL